MEVTVDSIRSDILHPCDLAEDIAIAHNYNKSNILDNSFYYKDN